MTSYSIFHWICYMEKCTLGSLRIWKLERDTFPCNICTTHIISKMCFFNHLLTAHLNQRKRKRKPSQRQHVFTHRLPVKGPLSSQHLQLHHSLGSIPIYPSIQAVNFNKCHCICQLYALPLLYSLRYDTPGNCHHSGKSKITSGPGTKSVESSSQLSPLRLLSMSFREKLDSGRMTGLKVLQQCMENVSSCTLKHHHLFVYAAYHCHNLVKIHIYISCRQKWPKHIMSLRRAMKLDPPIHILGCTTTPGLCCAGVSCILGRYSTKSTTF